MLTSTPEKAQAGKTTVITNLDTTQNIYTSIDNLRPPCCSNCNGPEQLIVEVLHLKNNTVDSRENEPEQHDFRWALDKHVSLSPLQWLNIVTGYNLTILNRDFYNSKDC